MVQFSDEQLNYFKIATLIIDEFPKALRQTFKFMWDQKFGPNELWDDSQALRDSFLAKEGGAGSTQVPTQTPYENWDCTALFKATIYAKSFALLDSSTGHLKTLSDLYVRPRVTRGLPHGSFHLSVVSPSGNQAETFALAIDQLRLLRNSFAHSTRTTMDMTTFNQYVHLAKNAFDALGLNTQPIDAVGNLKKSDFPTNQVKNLTRKIDYMKMAIVGVSVLLPIMTV